MFQNAQCWHAWKTYMMQNNVIPEYHDWFIWKKHTTIYETYFLEYLLFLKLTIFVVTIEKCVV